MLRILIVDDEKIILNGIKMMIEKSIKLSFETDIVLASSVPQAIEHLQYFTPDLIFTDISMPVKDGFELIRYVRENFENMNIIILTSHADFEYARLAVKYQIEDFILKPINEQILKEGIEAVYSSKQEREEERRQALKLEFRNMLLYDLSPSDLLCSEDELKSIFSYAYFTVILIEYGEEIVYGDSEAFSAVLDKDYENSYVFQFQEQRQLIAICNHKYFRVRNANLCRNIRNCMNMNEVHIGISMTSNSYQKLYSLYCDALQKIFYKRQFGKNNTFAEVSLLTYQECVKIFLENDANKREDMLKEYLKNIRAMANTIYSSELIYKSYFHNIRLFFEKNNIKLESGEIIEKTISIQEEWQLLPVILEHISELKKKIWKIWDTNNSDEQSRQLLNYIQIHYKKDIGLEDLAKYMGLHPNYICGLFKKNLGESYLSCLHKERIRHIKTMLFETDKTMEEIAKEVGYNSASQMARVFRKYELISPSDYRSVR